METVFVIGFADAVSGTKLIGPYKTEKDADDKARWVEALPFFQVHPIKTDGVNVHVEDSEDIIEEIDFNGENNLFTLAQGNPFEKMELTGLFKENLQDLTPLDYAIGGGYFVEIQRPRKE